MKLVCTGIAVRFDLPWNTSCRLGHDVAHEGLNAVADAIDRQADVVGVDIGSGHTGMYLEVRLCCTPDRLGNRVAELIEFSKGLKP